MDQTKTRVLIVDDDEELRAGLRRHLERARYEVFEAPGGAEALQLFTANPADVVIVDMLMPGKDGMETILDLLDAHPKLKVIAMTGAETGRPSWLSSAELLGAAVTLQKPFDPESLISVIQSLS